MKKAGVLSYPLSAQRRLRSDWVDAQADLSLHWAHSHFVGFVMSWLIYSNTVITDTTGLHKTSNCSENEHNGVSIFIYSHSVCKKYIYVKKFIKIRQKRKKIIDVLNLLRT